jgi:hypothetical protein
VINRNNVPFTLMPQRDRRQLPDRRAIWRGGRRAADTASANPLPAQGSFLLWTPSLEQTGRGVEKRILH